MNKTKQTFISIFSFLIILTLTGSVFAQDLVPAPPKAESGVGSGGSFSAAAIWGNDVPITNPALPQEINPAIVSTPDGTLYAAVDIIGESTIRLYRSTNGGLNWSYILWMTAEDDQYNPSITYAEDVDGKFIYVAAGVLSGTNHSVVVRRVNTVTLGEFSYWVEWPPFTMASASDQVHPSICTDNIEYPSGYFVYLTYAKKAIDYYPIMFSKSTDNGETYIPPVNITGGAENSSWASRSDIAYGESGLFVAYDKLGWDALASNWITKPYVTKSTDFGSTFGAAVKLSTDNNRRGYHPSVAVGHGLGITSSVVVAYTSDWGTDTDIGYSYSTDSGASWINSRASLGFSFDNEHSVDLAASHSGGRFHAVLQSQNYNVTYTSADVNTPNSWDSGRVVNQGSTASLSYPGPVVCVNPAKPLADEACVAWTDFRNGTGNYNAYFNKVLCTDLDSDGICDEDDNCPVNCNSQQLDADGDGEGDVCDDTPGCGGCGDDLCEQEC
jgi:hypothetical protein